MMTATLLGGRMDSRRVVGLIAWPLL